MDKGGKPPKKPRPSRERSMARGLPLRGGDHPSRLPGSFGAALDVDWLRIAQIAPLYEKVPPWGYGGTGRVGSYLTEELGRQGPQVALSARRAVCPVGRPEPGFR